jgi:hypothetical protein
MAQYFIKHRDNFTFDFLFLVIECNLRPSQWQIRYNFQNLYVMSGSSIVKVKVKYDEVFSGYQPGQMFERWANQRFEDHLCPRPQGTTP